jgi:tripartite-type tricarboxylate transporter receptor subunit TctC
MGNISHAINVTLYSKLAYDLAKDFAPVTLLASTPNILVVHPSIPAKSVKELIALARARPGQLDYASSWRRQLVSPCCGAIQQHGAHQDDARPL